MRCSVLVAALSALVACGGIALGADIDAAPTPDALAASTPQVGTLRVNTKASANVRYSPTTQSKVVVTLPKGTEIEILGPAKVADWFVIRFPRQGKAWVHSKVLQSIDGGKRWRVTEDKSRARDDSTLKSEIVAELNKGEVLEDKGQLNGDWRAVYLPNAVAYIHKSVLDLPDDFGHAVDVANQRAEDSKAKWFTAQAVYANFYAQLQKDPQNAMTLDWAGLGTLLDAVVHDHPDADTRVSAQRLKDGIVNVAAHSDALAKAKGITPVKQPLDTSVPAGMTLPAQPTASGTAARPAPVDPTVPQMLGTPDTQPAPADVKPMPAPTPATTAQTPPDTTPLTLPPVPTAPQKMVAQGFVTQENYDQVGVTDVLKDNDGKVVAFLKPKVGSDVQFSNYVWRWVGVYGEVQKVDQAKHSLGYDVPLVIVGDLKLDPR